MPNRRTLLAAGLVGAASGVAGRPAQALPRTTRGTLATGPHGCRLRVRDWGFGKPVVFLSGWGLPSDFWDYHIADLTAAGLRCVAYDRRGHGRSDEPGWGYDLDTLADDLAAVLETLDLSAVTLVGYSFGACEAARYLARHGEDRVARVVFIAPMTPCLARKNDNPDGVPRDHLAAARARIAADFPAWLADEEEHFWRGSVGEPLRAWARGLMRRTPLPVLLACHETMCEADLREDLRRLGLEALVLHGDEDTSAPLPLTGSPTAELVPGARLEIIAGAPHGLPLTARALVVERIAALAQR